MPTYQYACTSCGERLEVVQKFSDDALTVCPSCEGRLRKVYSAVGVGFKGSGFYSNDSRSTASSAPPAAPAKADPGAAATPSSSSSDSSSGGSGSSSSGSSSSSTGGSSPPAPAAAPSTSKKSGDSKVA